MGALKNNKTSFEITIIRNDDNIPCRIYANRCMMQYFDNARRLWFKKDGDEKIYISTDGEGKYSYFCDIMLGSAVTYDIAAAKLFKSFFVSSSGYEAVTVSGWVEKAPGCLVYDPSNNREESGGLNESE